MNTQKGISAIVILLLVAVVIGFGVYIFIQKKEINSITQSTDRAVHQDDNKNDSAYAQYNDAKYGYAFSYPMYMNVQTLETDVPDGSLKMIFLGMDSLPGLNNFITISVASVRNERFTKSSDSDRVVEFGNTRAVRHDWSVGGGELVTFEILLKNGNYLYVDTDTYTTGDRTFDYDDKPNDDQFKELIKTVDGFSKIISSFTVSL